MSKHYSVSLPVRPYIKKYIASVEGTPIEFKGTSMFCLILRAYMENKSYTGFSKTQLETAIGYRTATVQIIIPIKKIYTIGTEISPDGILLINRFLESLFERALVKFMNENTSADGRYKGFKEAYVAFAKLYSIDLEEDITLDGLKQMDYRLRKKIENKGKKGGNFFSNLVPSL